MINKVTDNLYRGARPNFEDLQGAQRKDTGLGLTTVFDLENDKEATMREYEWCKTLNLEFVNPGMNEILRPAPAELNLIAIDIMTNLAHGKTVLVHCKHGQDRTGFVIADYRMKYQGWPFQVAYQECLDYGHKAWFYDYFPLYWLKSLKGVK